MWLMKKEAIWSEILKLSLTSQSGFHRENEFIRLCVREQWKKKHMPVVLVSKCLHQVLRLPEYIDYTIATIHTHLMGQGCIVCTKRTGMRKKTDSKQNKSKTVVNNEPRHCHAKPQTNLSLEEKRKQVITLNFPSSGQGPTYLVSQS